MSDLDAFLNKIICGDSIETMKKMPDQSVDLIVTSPPYNLKISTGNGMKDGKEKIFRRCIDYLKMMVLFFKIINGEFKLVSCRIGTIL